MRRRCDHREKGIWMVLSSFPTMKCVVQILKKAMIVRRELRTFTLHSDAGHMTMMKMIKSVSQSKQTKAEMQYSRNIGSHTREIAHESVAHAFTLGSSHHQCAIFCRLRTEREVGPGARWEIAFHRSHVKVYQVIVRRRFAVSKASPKSERVDTN